MGIEKILMLLGNISTAAPVIVELVQHYQEIINSDSALPQDKERAHEILERLHWKKWEDIA